MRGSWLCGHLVAAGVAMAAQGAVSVVSIDTREAINERAAQTSGFRGAINAARDLWRRAAKLEIDVTLNGEFDPAVHALDVIAEHQFNAAPVKIRLGDSGSDPLPAGVWATRVESVTAAGANKRVRLALQFADDAPVGEYSFTLEVRTRTATPAVLTSKAFPRPVVMLFNAWSERDAVYYKNADQRADYVLGEAGRFRAERTKDMNDREEHPWRLATLSNTTLEAALKIMRDRKMNAATRAAPHELARQLALALGDGSPSILVGNWQEPPPAGGTSPREWTSSEDIFKKYLADGQVKWVRCWIYANCLTSVSRALGVPARQVSNLKSAHDYDNPLNGFVDKYWKKVGANWVEDTDRTEDVAWGFHAWTEMWMKRPDLMDRDGWQAVDATPQQQPGDALISGPAAVSAVKAKAGGDFDVEFVTAEVYSPIRHTRQTPAGDKVHNTQNGIVGATIVTKVVGQPSMMTVRDQYRAAARGGNDSDGSGLGLTWSTPQIADPGDPVVVTARVENNTGLSVVVRSTLAAHAELENEAFVADILPPAGEDLLVGPGEVIDRVYSIAWEDWQSIASLTDWMAVRGALVCEGLDTAAFTAESVQYLSPPVSLSVDAVETAPLGSKINATVHFTNPLSISLTGLRLNLSGDDGLVLPGGSSEDIVLNDLGPGESVILAREFTAVEAGGRMIIAQLRADQFPESEAGVALQITDCPADFDNNGVVDDADFAIFSAAYDLFLNPPAPARTDLNLDGYVDDQDFVIFAEAYDLYLCP